MFVLESVLLNYVNFWRELSSRNGLFNNWGYITAKVPYLDNIPYQAKMIVFRKFLLELQEFLRLEISDPFGLVHPLKLENIVNNFT